MTANEVEIGTLYLDRDGGNVYRYVGSWIDWEADDPDRKVVPDYAVQTESGVNSVVHALPDAAEVIWRPNYDHDVAPVGPFTAEVSALWSKLTIRADERGI